MKKCKIQLATILLLFFVWDVVSKYINSPIMPDSKSIIHSVYLIFSDTDYSEHIISTCKITMYGIIAASILGLFFAVFCSLKEKIKFLIEPFISKMKNIPAIAMFPMILLLIGTSDISRETIIFWTAFPPVFISSLYGLENVDRTVIEAAMLSADKAQILIHIKIPLAFGNILNGIRIGIGTGFISVVTAEMLGASKGIGYMILWNTNAFKYADVYANIIIVAIIATAFNFILEITEKIIEKRIYS